MTPVSTLKKHIADGNITVSLRMPITATKSMTEFALGKGDYQFLYIDGQHTAYTDWQIVEFCAMAEEIGMPVQMRIPHTRFAFMVGRFFDLGLSSVIVPEVEDAATVHDALDYTYYGPQGRRSWGGEARYGMKNWGGPVDRLEYAAWWNQHVVLCIQLESIAAINNAAKFAMPGVDYVAFGPNDLMFNIEQYPEYPLQSADDCRRNVAAQLKGTGVRLGMNIATTPDERGKYMDMGLTVFGEIPQFE